MIVSYLGTKGGTGTTTLAVNGAADLRRVTKRSTVIVDLKVGFGDVALFLGLRPHHTLIDLLDQGAWLEPGTLGRLVSPHESGLRIVAAGNDFARPSVRDVEAVEQTLRALNGLYDFVVIDAGSTLVPCAGAALQLSDVVLLVTNPDVPCLRNLQHLIDSLKLAAVPAERLKVVLNRTSDYGVLSMAQIERVLGLRIDFCVGSDYRTVASAVNNGVPVSALRLSALHGQLDAIARWLAARLTTVDPR